MPTTLILSSTISPLIIAKLTQFKCRNALPTHQQTLFQLESSQSDHYLRRYVLVKQTRAPNAHPGRKGLIYERASEVALCPLLPWYCVKSSWNVWFRDYQHVFYLESLPCGILAITPDSIFPVEKSSSGASRLLLSLKSLSFDNLCLHNIDCSSWNCPDSACKDNYLTHLTWRFPCHILYLSPP